MSSANFVVRAAGTPVPHLFDTFAPDPQRTLIQQGAVTLLSALKRPTGYLAEVMAIGGIVRSHTDGVDIEWLMKTFNRTPAIGVATGTRTFGAAAIGGKHAVMSSCELLLYFATQHSRDYQRGRQESDALSRIDNTADPGLHVAMEHALELMIGAYPTTLTSTVKQIAIQREEELATLPEITIWLQTYHVTLQSRVGGREWRTPAQLLESIGWRVTTNPDEPVRPAAATVSTSLDADTDLTE